MGGEMSHVQWRILEGFEGLALRVTKGAPKKKKKTERERSERNEKRGKEREKERTGQKREKT